MTPRLLRAFAAAIAVAAFIDPAVMLSRPTKPVISVIAPDPRDAAAAEGIARDMADEFTIVRAPFGAAAATVVVGSRVPDMHIELADPVFVVMPEPSTVRIERVDAPVHAPLDARIPINVTVRVRGARGRPLAVTLRSNGVAIDRFDHDVASDDDSVAVSLAYVPAVTGAVPLHVTASVAAAHDVADVLVDVRDSRWRALFFDPRPSWLATFVRREVEQDTRFIATSRVVTARDISVDAGSPPATVSNAADLAEFDVVVIGAPDALTDGEVTGLESYMRRTGGAVVLLLDSHAGGAYERLAPVVRRDRAARDRPMTIAAALPENASLDAGEITWPEPLPATADAIAVDSARHPVIWRAPVGAGLIVINGALDAWKYRDPDSGFGRFWRKLIADAAANRLPAIELAVARPVLATGEETAITVTVRDAALATGAARASIAAVVEGSNGSTPLRFWPDASPGVFRAVYRAATDAGIYRVVTVGNGTRADIPIAVLPVVARPTSDQRELLNDWAAAHGGSAVGTPDLRSRLRQGVVITAGRERWYPMRSVWWIVVFTLALGGAWWRERRVATPSSDVTAHDLTAARSEP